MATRKKSNKIKTKYNIDSKGAFVIENYNHTKPFSNFFPGIAGIWGIPMWVFYVNRGQCVTSFGIEGKDKSILEFQPANKAYRLTSTQGFRTFLKVKSGKKETFWEPFQNSGLNHFETAQKMSLTSHDLTIEDVNQELGIKVTVNYFTVPEEPFAGLVRRLTITNLMRKKCDIDLIDGLPSIVAFGIKDWLIKNLTRTVEAWVKVRNIDNKIPFYQLNVEVSDTPQVKHIKEGNFYLSFAHGARSNRLLNPIVEAACVFGQSHDFLVPEKFVNQVQFKIPGTQETSNRTPSAMSHGKFSLLSKESQKITSVIGFARDEAQVNRIAKQILESKYVEQKSQANKNIVDGVKNYAFTASSSKQFDLYSQQTFLDNVLRGGLPVSLPTGAGNVAFNVYSRKHGDLERDYNYFKLAPTYYSQGNGNYRDVNQNRRNDVWFNSDVKDSIIVNFLSLVQADGYNPLVVMGMNFSCQDLAKVEKLLDETIKGFGKERIREYIKEGFQPGELLEYVERNDIKLKVSIKAFLGKVLDLCQKKELADHGEGFWSDHWTYNLDLIESYLSVYPEELRSLLFSKKEFTFYHNSHYVVPREEKYVLTSRGVRQYDSVLNDTKAIKTEDNGHRLRIQDGQGEIYRTNLICKLLCIIANKVSSLDPSGIGIEMEADKPNWYDALNGLPGLMGSSISETLELKRLSGFLLKCFDKLELKDDVKVTIFSELHTLITRLSHVLSVETDPMSYWLKANDIKEHYRYRIRKGIDGKEDELNIVEVKKFLELVFARTTKSAYLAREKGGLYPTYFYHEVTKFEKLEKLYDKKMPFVRALQFKQHALPLFLGGFVHGLRTSKNAEEARRLYQKIKKSSLYDKKLKMYKVNSNLSRESEEIGRTRIFPSGWLENESIWLHMEYKYLLELLRNEMYEEFYETLKNTLVPFLKPERYGRSTLENSSFIVSSAHEDEGLHGQGFVARLSGSTAEFLHIWLYMNVGKNPFFINEKGELNLKFRPSLPGWLFTKTPRSFEYINQKGEPVELTLPKNSYAFNLFGSSLVVYHNKRRKNTYGRTRARIKTIDLTYPKKKPITLTSSVISTQYANDIRNCKIERIDVYFE